MENSEDELLFDSDILGADHNNREICIAISWINNILSINSSKYIHSEMNTNEEAKHISYWVVEQNQSTIIDIPKLIRNKDVQTIRALTLKSIAPDLEFKDSHSEEKVKSDEGIMDDRYLERSNDNEIWGLANRFRNQKLSAIQLTYLKNQINNSKSSSKQLSLEFNVSPSLINKIKRTDLSLLWSERSRKLIKINGIEMNSVIEELKCFITNVDYAFNSIEITNHINSKLNKNYKPCFIRKLMKNELDLTFKKVKPRPNNVNFDILKASRQLFAVKYSQIISSDTLVINIDETSINRHIQISYSWSKKGIPKEAKNSPFTGSVNCMMAILWNGNWFSLLSSTTSNSNKFDSFLDKLNYWLTANKIFQKKEVLILLDNWSIHKTAQIFQKFKEINYNVIFLPAYTPQFAPIEMWFSMIKRNLRQIYNGKIVKLSLKSSYNNVYNALRQIKWEYIKQLFKEMYSTINNYL